MTIILQDRETAEAIARRLNTTTLINSGWHVYRNMEQLLGQKTATKERCPFSCPYYGKNITYEKGMLPKTEDILSRAINLSIGLHDKGIGAVYGLSPKDGIEEAKRKADEFVGIVKDIIG